MSQTRCFFYGIGIGVAAGVLLAPRSGISTRKRIAGKARDGQDFVLRGGAELRDTVVETLNRTKRAAKTTADGIGAALDAGKAQFVG